MKNLILSISFLLSAASAMAQQYTVTSPDDCLVEIWGFSAK